MNRRGFIGRAVGIVGMVPVVEVQASGKPGQAGEGDLVAYRELGDLEVIQDGDECTRVEVQRSVDRIIGMTVTEAREAAGAPTLRVRRPIEIGSWTRDPCTHARMHARSGCMHASGPSGR